MKKIALVTGGGTGLGLATAQRLCAEGHTVYIAARREPVLQKAVDSVRASQPDAAIHYRTLDVRSHENVSSVVQSIVDTSGSPPHIVVNNAAGNFISPTEKLSMNAWRTIMDIVFFGTLAVVTDIGKRWIATRAAATEEARAAMPQVVFVAVGTSYATTGAAFVAPSAAAKAAVWNLHQSLAVEWGKYNMRFVMVSPGPIYTEGAFSRLDPTGQLTSEKNISRHVPLQRMGKPEELAEVMAFVTSDKASWLTGTNIDFDGGNRVAGGEFQALRRVTPEQWDMMEKMIRSANAKSKEGREKGPTPKL